MAVALGRWCIGMIFLFAGIGKITGGVSGFAENYLVKTFTEKTWLPEWLLRPYGYALPFIEVILGAMLILGLFRNFTLFVTGLFLISLTFGQLLLMAPQVMFQNMLFTFLAAGLLFLHEHDRWVIPCGCKKEEPISPTPVL